MKYNDEYVLRTQSIRQLGEDVCGIVTKCLSDRGYYGCLTTEDVYFRGDPVAESTINIAFAVNGEHIADVKYPVGDLSLKELVAPVSNQAATSIVELIESKQVPDCKVWKVDRKGNLSCIDIGELVRELLYD